VAIWGVAVVGIDGCRGGWIAVVWRDADLDVRRWSSIRELDEVTDAEVVAIDIPLGLSDNGERLAEVLARRRLPGRASTIFNAPARACLAAADDYARANELSRAHGGKGLSRQSFALLAKIRDVDEYWRSAPCPMYEVHPELSFARLNARTPLASKKSAEGSLARRELLRAQGINLDDFLTRRAPGVAADDVLDAGVCAWTARRIAADDVERLPDTGVRDATGREMAIRV